GVKVHIVSNDQLFEQSKERVKGIESIDQVITIYGTTGQGVMGFEEALEMGARKDKESPNLFDKLRSEIEPDDLATLIYTSGTTGDPKGVMLSHWNIASNLLASQERIPFDDRQEGQRMLSYLPLSHVFERLITYLFISLGYPIYYIEDINEIREDFEYVKPYYFATVPRLLEKIHTGVKVKGQEMSGLKKRL